jgi:DNA ligase (NAD+)
MIQELRELGVKTCHEEEEKKGKLAGLNFVFTGTLKCCSRERAKEIVESLGGNVLDTVSKKVHYIVVGEEPGSKLQKAQKLGTVKIINEEEFLKLIGGENAE